MTEQNEFSQKLGRSPTSNGSEIIQFLLIQIAIEISPGSIPNSQGGRKEWQQPVKT